MCARVCVCLHARVTIHAFRAYPLQRHKRTRGFPNDYITPSSLVSTAPAPLKCAPLPTHTCLRKKRAHTYLYGGSTSWLCASACASSRGLPCDGRRSNKRPRVWPHECCSAWLMAAWRDARRPLDDRFRCVLPVPISASADEQKRERVCVYECGRVHVPRCEWKRKAAGGLAK